MEKKVCISIFHLLDCFHFLHLYLKMYTFIYIIADGFQYHSKLQ